MIGPMSTWAKLIAAVTLLVAAFVVAPMADAATCAPEAPAAHLQADHDPSTGDHTGKGADHGVCAHGHCHHVTGERASTPEIGLAGYEARTLHGRLRDDVAPSHAPDGLKRPPRA